YGEPLDAMQDPVQQNVGLRWVDELIPYSTYRFPELYSDRFDYCWEELDGTAVYTEPLEYVLGCLCEYTAGGGPSPMKWTLGNDVGPVGGADGNGEAVCYSYGAFGN
ncbi:hypothetical protein THAOC_08139, partial [Thalassiosira oceanica]